MRIRKLAVNVAIRCILVVVLRVWASPVQAAELDIATQTSTNTNVDDVDYSNSDADIDPILKEAFLKFEAHDLDGGFVSERPP